MNSSFKRWIALSALVGVLGIATGCCKDVDYPPTAPTIDSMFPDCGPASGGTEVTVTGTSLMHVTAVMINGEPQDLVSAEMYELTFKTVATPVGTHTVSLDFSFDILCKNGKVDDTITDSISSGDFEFVDSLKPIVYDARPEEPDHINTEPYEGNCGGGYWIEVHGDNFVQLDTGEIPMVIFNGSELYDPDVEFNPATPTVLRVRVPICPVACQTTWVPVIVRNPPYYCALDSDPGAEFFYNQEDCEPYDDSLQFGYAEADEGPIYLDTADILSASAGMNDVAAACVRSTDTTGSLVILLGDGNGNINKEDSVDFATNDARPTAIALGDFDGNAFADAAVTLNSEAEGLSQIAIFFNSGDGFTNDDALYIDIGSDLTDLAIADLDGDDDDDIVAVSRGTGELVFIEQTGPRVMGDTTMAAVPMPGGGAGETDGPFALTTGDFDAGGIDNDLAVATHADTVELFVTASSSSAPVEWSDAVETGAGLIGVAAGPFFGDGAAHLAVVCADDGTIELYPVTASSSTFDATPSTHPLSGSAPIVFGVGAFDEDGRGDLAVAHTGTLGTSTVEVIELTRDSVYASYSIDTSVDCSDIVADFMNSNDAATREDLVMGLYYPSLFSSVMIAKNKGTGFD